MFDPAALFKNRLSAHLKLLNRYLRYIFNGHFMIALLFIIVTLSVYYQRWLEEAPITFPAALVIGVVLAIVVTYNPLQLFLKEPDKVFIIVKEALMRRYFLYGLLYNYVVQLYVVVFGIAVVSPLYYHFYRERELFYDISIVIIVLITKIWNLNISFQNIRHHNERYLALEWVIRFGLHIALFYTLVLGEYFLIVGFITVAYYNIIYFMQRKHSLIMWEKLIENDEQRLASFYRFVRLFADVPHVKSRIRKRLLLTKLVERLTPFQHGKTSSYLYWLTFIRGGDYLPLFIRLTVLGAVVVYILPNNWLQLIVALLFIYMTSFQLMTLYYHHRMNIWQRIYPAGRKQYEEGFLQLIKQLSFLQIALLAIVFIVQANFVLLILFASSGILCTIIFVNSYVKNKITKADVF